MTHTPGPWKFVQSHCGRWAVYSKNGTLICLLGDPESDKETNETFTMHHFDRFKQNGPLIAAAPALLAALKETMGLIEELAEAGRPEYQQASAAVALAKKGTT
jgi:hypothetical protein